MFMQRYFIMKLIGLFRIFLQHYIPSWLYTVLLSFLLILTPTAMAADTQDFGRAVVVAHSGVDISRINRHQLKAIFSMRLRQWTNGDEIVVYVLPSESSEHQDFVFSQLKIFPYQLDREWNRLVYSGFGIRPETVVDQRKMLQAVSDTPGAIGYTKDIVLAKNMGLKIYE